MQKAKPTYAENDIQEMLRSLPKPLEVPEEIADCPVRSAFFISRGTIGIHPVSAQDIYAAAFPNLRSDKDSDKCLAHDFKYAEARATVAQNILAIHYGLGWEDTPVHTAKLCQDPKGKVLWVELDHQKVETV